MQPTHPSLRPDGTAASLADGGAFALPPDMPLDLGAVLARTARLHRLDPARPRPARLPRRRRDTGTFRR